MIEAKLSYSASPAAVHAFTTLKIKTWGICTCKGGASTHSTLGLDCENPASRAKNRAIFAELVPLRTFAHFTKMTLSAVFLLALMPLAGCGPKVPVAADQPVPVLLRAPSRVQQPVSVAASGAVEANVTAQGAFQIAGRDYRNAYDAAKGQEDAAEAVNSKAQEGLRSQELEQARIDYERWLDEYKRMKFLYDHKSLPASDFVKIEAGYKAAQQRYDMARQGTREQDKEAATGQFHAAAAGMHEAQKRLADCQLRAPIAGFVGMKRIDVGDTVGAGMPVIGVLDLNPVKVRVAIPESEIGKVQQGARATVTIPSLDGKQFEGKVEAVGVAADPASRTYTVKIAVQNPERLLRAGMVAEARIYNSKMVNAITVPGGAVIRDAHGVTQVYVLEPARQRVYARRVDVGAPLNNEVEILSGLAGNEQVVVAGQQNVREGSPVKIVGGGQ